MKRLCYEIITIILTHAFILSGPALAISNRDLQQPQDAPRVQGKQDCLGPEILLPIARFENIFKNGYVSWENKIYDVLNAWLVKNHVISERLRLDDIEQKVGQDINYLTARAEEVEKKARALIALCRETPSRANYKKLLNFFKDTRIFFWNFDTKIKCFIHEYLRLFKVELPKELEELKRYTYARVDEQKSQEFILKNVFDAEIGDRVLEMCNECLDDLAKEHKLRIEAKEKGLARIRKIKQKNTKRWQENDFGLVSSKLKELIFWGIKDNTADYKSVTESWVLDSMPRWKELAKELDTLLESAEYLSSVNAPEILRKIEQAIKLINSYHLFFSYDEKNEWTRWKSEVMERFIRKLGIVPQEKEIFCAHVDEHVLKKIRDSSPNIEDHIKDALKEEKEVVLYASHENFNALLFNFRGFLPNELRKIKVLACGQDIFFGDDFSQELKMFLSRSIQGDDSPRLISMPVIVWLQNLVNSRIILPAQKKKLKDETGLLNAEFISSLLKQFYEFQLKQEKKENDPEYNSLGESDNVGLLYNIFPYLSDDALFEVLRFVYALEDEQARRGIIYQIAQCFSYLSAMGRGERFAELLLKATIREQDELLRKRKGADFIDKFAPDNDVFWIAQELYPQLSFRERGRLINILFSMYYSDVSFSSFFSILSFISKDPHGLKDLLMYYHAFAVLQDLDSVRKDEFDDLIGDLLAAESKQIYYLLRNFVKDFPKGEAISFKKRGEVVELVVELDDGAALAGLNGKTIFSSIRKIVHEQPNLNTTEIFYNLLCYWKDLDPKNIDKNSGFTVLRELEKQDFQYYHQALTFYYQELKHTVPREIPGKTLNPFDIFVLSVDKKALLAKEKELFEKLKNETGIIDSYEKSSEFEERQKAIRKTTVTILAYQASAKKFGSSLAGLKQAVEGTCIDEFKNIEKLRTEFVALLNSESGEKLERLKKYALLRKTIYEKIRESDSVNYKNASRDNNRQLAELLVYDITLEKYGNIIFSGYFDQLKNLKQINKIEQACDTLALLLKNYVYSGLGGAAVEEFLAELEYAENIRVSQLLNIINSLEFEFRKALKRASADYRGKFSKAALKIKNVPSFKTKYVSFLEDMLEGSDELKNRKIAEQMEEIAIGDIIRESGFPALESVLVNFSRLLEAELKKADRVVLNKRDEKTIIPEDLFWRFQAGEKEKRIRLISKCGKKGKRAAEMAEAGMPVPPGVIISAEVCNNPHILKTPEFNEQLAIEVERLRRIDEFPTMKLFLFARSGSAYSMPGLMATIPNLGMNELEVERLAKEKNNFRFAYDAYGNFLRGYGIHVLGIPEKDFQNILNLNKQEKPKTETGMKELVRAYKKLISSCAKGIPDTLLEQVQCCIDAIYKSWSSAGAKNYRGKHNISNYWGTAAILQKAVFGNLPGLSGAGAISLRFDKYSQPFIEGRFRFNSQGEALMSGAPGNYVVIGREEANEGEFSLEEEFPEIYEELLAYAIALHKLFNQPQRFEFTIEQGKLYILQSSDSDEYDDAELPEFVDDVTEEPVAIGRGAAGGAFRGIVAVDMQSAERLQKEFIAGEFRGLDVDGVVLILERVNPEDINGIPDNAAILAGEMSIHCETLANKNGISSCYHFPSMKFIKEKEQGFWQINKTVFKNKDIISFDGHINRHVYHKSGFVYKHIIPLKEKESENITEKSKLREKVDELKIQEQYIEKAI